MLKKIASSIVERIVFHCDESIKSKRNIYIYAVMLLLSMITTITTMVIIGALLHRLRYTLVFICVFVGLRLFSNGYHASTFRNCFLLTNGIHLSIIGLIELSNRGLFEVAIILMIFFCSNVIVTLYSPIGSENHPLTEEKYKKYKLLAYICMSLIDVFIICFYLFSSNLDIALTMIMSLFAVAVLMLIAKRKEMNLKYGNLGINHKCS